jgi:hypothetical protein
MESLAPAKLNHLKSPFHFMPFWRRTWRSGGNALSIGNLKIGSFPSRRYRGRKPCWGHAILRRYIRPAAKNQGIEKRIGWHTFSPDLRNTSEERRHRIQGDARADAAFFAAIHAGHLCTSDDAGQARCASGCGVANVPSRVEQRSRFRLRGESDLIQSTGEVSGRRTQMGRKTVPFLHPSVFLWNNA